MAGIIFSIAGLVFLLTGKIKISKKRSVEGIRARLVGLFLLGTIFVPQLVVNFGLIRTQKVATIFSFSYIGVGLLLIIVLIIVAPANKVKKVVQKKCPNCGDIFKGDEKAKYEEAKVGTFKLLPPEFRHKELKKDYRAMQNMIFGERIEFEEIISVLKE